MIKRVTHVHLGSIWSQSDPLDVPYCPDQFLGLDFFAVSYTKPALSGDDPNCTFGVDNFKDDWVFLKLGLVFSTPIRQLRTFRQGGPPCFRSWSI